MLNVRSWTHLSLLCAMLAIGAWSCASEEPSGGRRGGQSGMGAGATGYNPVGGSGAISGSGSPIGGSGGGLAGASGVGVAGNGGSGDECASASIYVSNNTPQIMFVIDGSGSMCESFGGSTRWNSLRAALLAADTGLIPRLQATAEFGLLVYDGTIDPFLAIGAIGTPSPQCAGMYLEQKAMGECPGLVSVPVALNNSPAIDMAYPMTELGGSTPTDKAMNRAIDDLIAIRPTNPDATVKPQYVILATDGAPNDICVGGVGGDGMAQKQGVIAAVDRGAMNSISTFVVSLAGGDANLQTHLDEVARHGDPMNMMARTYTPESPEELVTQLAALVGGAVGCDITLNGMVQAGRECSGTVTMNGVELPCCADGMCAGDPPTGWRLKDPSTIELVGNTCLDFLTASSAQLTAGFPCGVFVVQ
jgi:hypothetical protein